ncbi:MAG: hypothetical protein OHK0039_28290 [Bacteroidia bacterium]
MAAFTSSDTTVCLGTAIAFEATGGDIDTWTWDFGPGATPGSASGPGPHMVSYATPDTPTVSLAVSGPGGSDTLARSIGVLAPPTLAIDPARIEVCEGSPVQQALTVLAQGGTAPYTYIWTCDQPGLCGFADSLDASAAFSPALPGGDSLVYSVMVADAQGYTVQSDPVRVRVLAAPLPVWQANGTADTLFASSGAETYAWFLVDSTSGQTSAIAGATLPYLPLDSLDSQPGYQPLVLVEAHYANGCTRRSAARRLPTPASTAIGTSLRATLRVYPNPGSGICHVVLPEGLAARTWTLRCYDLQGRLLQQTPLRADHSFDTHTWPTGICLIELESAGLVLRTKMLVE